MALPPGPNQRWSLDFLSDAFADGRRFRILAIVDDFTRECLALIPDTSLPGLRVVRELDAFIESFNGRLRDELLNETLFTSLAHVREALAIWKDDYNTTRPHSALGNLPPAVFAKLSAPAMQRDGTLRYLEGSAPRPVAPPSQQGSNDA
jgi:putative transposase